MDPLNFFFLSRSANKQQNPRSIKKEVCPDACSFFLNPDEPVGKPVGKPVGQSSGQFFGWEGEEKAFPSEFV